MLDAIQSGSQGPESDDRRLIVFGDLIIDPKMREATRGSRHFRLAPRELALLAYLIVHHDRVVEETRLMDDLFATTKAGRVFNTLWVHMHRLRRKIDADHPVRLIHTIRGAGYVMRKPRIVSNNPVLAMTAK